MGLRLSDLPGSSALLYTLGGSTQTFLQMHQDLGSLYFLANYMMGGAEDNPCKWGRDGDVLLRRPLEGTSYSQAARSRMTPVRRMVGLI